MIRSSHLLSIVLGAAAFAAPPFVVAQDAPAGGDAKKPEQPAVKDPVDFKKLKELLPDTVAGLKRSNAEGSKQGMAGMKLSQAQGTYSEEGKDQNATVTINDYGAMPGMLEGMSGWMNMEIDNDSDTQSSKTLTINGYKAYEEYNKQDKSGHIIVVVGNRFWVEVQVNSGIDADALKATAESLKLKELEALGK